MRKTLVVTAGPIPTSNINIGSLIVSLTEPQQGAHAPMLPSASELLPPEPQSSYKSLIREYKKTKFRPFLAVLGFEYSPEEDDSVMIESTKGLRYLLGDPLAWFKKLCKLKDTREWIVEMDRAGSDIFLISGYFTFQDARVEVKGKHEKKKAVTVDVPIDKMASAAAGILPVDIGGDVKFDYERVRGKEKDASYEAPGEQVYALQVKRVKVKFLPSDAYEPAFLSIETRWIDLVGDRGEGGEIVEVDLSDVLRLGKPTNQVKDEDYEEIYLIIEN